MQIKFFTIPITQTDEAEKDLNGFLSSHKIIETDKQLIQTSTGAYWCFSISYISQRSTNYSTYTKKKVNYKEVLDEKTFLKFTQLREIRKQLSKEDAVSAFVVATDAELAAISSLLKISLSTLKTIDNFGTKKIDKYGQRIIDKLNEQQKSR